MNAEINDFSNYLRTLDRSPITVSGYLRDLDLFSTWFEQTNGTAFAAENITSLDIRDYRQYLQTIRGMRAVSVNRKLSAISAFLNWACQSGKISSSPMEHVHQLARTVPGPRYLDRNQQNALLRTLEKEHQQATQQRYPYRWRIYRRDVYLVRFLLATGIRLSEVVSMQLSSFTLERGRSTLVVHGKGNKERIVPLNPDACQALQDWLSIRPQTDLPNCWLSMNGSDADYPPRPLSARSINMIFQRIAHLSGISNLTPHLLRHTFAKNLINHGFGLETVAALLGHSNLNTTRLYVTPNSQDLARAVNSISQHE